MKDFLLSETRDLYFNIQSIYKEKEYDKSYELNNFWANKNMEVMLRVIRDSSSALEAIHSIQKTRLFSVNTSESIKEKAVDWLLREQKTRGINLSKFDFSVQESTYSYPDNNVCREGRIFTPDFLRTVSIAHQIKKFCSIPNSRFRVIELGAGCGHLARTIKLLISNCSHVIIDIPETLFFSYIFLRLNFPEAKTIFATDPNQIKGKSLQKFDYVFVPTIFAEHVLENDFDIFINTASLGEMKNAVIRYWMNFIQRKLNLRFIFTLNRYLNTIFAKLDHWRLNENECSVLYDSNWRVLNWELEPPYTRCPYGDTIITRNLEIIAERGLPFVQS